VYGLYQRVFEVESHMNRKEHLLVIAAEECAEVAQRCAKALRFGLEQVQEDSDDRPEENPQRLTNKERIAEEFAHLIAAMNMLGITVAVHRVDAKIERVEQYMKRSERCGTLQA
jgi:NTP pyrophosphatase (non-canonical NTP hydrolase)